VTNSGLAETHINRDKWNIQGIYSNLKENNLYKPIKAYISSRTRQRFVSDYLDNCDYDRNVNIHNRYEEAKAVLMIAQDNMAKYYNCKHCASPKFSTGDKAWLDTQNVQTDSSWHLPRLFSQAHILKLFGLLL
jgi:hypothetical protein